MTETHGDSEADPALEALAALSNVARVSAEQLSALDEDLSTMQRRRRRGWSWRRIMAFDGSTEPLSSVAKLLADLAAAIGSFRRALTHALRKEGMRVVEIAKLLGVSRQRVSAVIRPRRP